MSKFFLKLLFASLRFGEFCGLSLFLEFLLILGAAVGFLVLFFF